MTPGYGATEEDWFQWDSLLSCTSDLLPVVCRPGMPIAPTSNLTTYGKVPSRYDRERRVVGFPGWTAHQATGAEVDRWRHEPDFGICLQTRRLRAIDVDVTDPETAQRIWAFLWGWHGYYFPIRFRADSSKFLVLFELPGDYGKRTLQVGSWGMIEFLAGGNQCLVSGTHPGGARYEWIGIEDGVPVLPIAEWDQLRAELSVRFGFGASWSESRLSVSRGLTEAVDLAQLDDPVIPYLQSNGLVERTSADGRLHVRCPWVSEHTSGADVTASTYFPAGTGGYETGAYHCLHAHCSQRSTSEFLLTIGYTLSEFEDLTAFDDESAVLGAFGATDVTPSGNESPILLPRFEDTDKHGRPLWTLMNVITAMGILDTFYHEVRVSFDAYTDRVLIRYGPDAPRPMLDDDYTEIMMRLYRGSGGRAGFLRTTYAPQILRAGIHRVAMQNKFDSAIDWLTSLPPWDGTPRVTQFCSEYLGAARSRYADAVSRYWWTAHAGRILTPGVQADMAIVLISGQGTGKTSSVKAIVPSLEHYSEIDLSERDDNLKRVLRGKLIGELGELRGLSTRDNEGIKAFVSRQHEEWTPKYMEMPRTFHRRLVLVGTSNQEEFLADGTGNRRWLPIRVGEKQDREAIVRDRDQLWAEGAVLYRTHGVLWEEAQQLARDEHPKFEVAHVWEDLVDRWLHQPDLANQKPCDRPYITIEEIFTDALHADLKNIRPHEKQQMGVVLRKFHYVKKDKWTGTRNIKIWCREKAA